MEKKMETTILGLGFIRLKDLKNVTPNNPLVSPM